MQVGASTQRLPADGLSFDGGSISSNKANKANKANKVGVLLFSFHDARMAMSTDDSAPAQAEPAPA
jgi:hypothetical protein